MRRKLTPAPSVCQSGAALLIVLVVLTIIMLLGLASAQTALMNEKSSRNDRDRQLAFQAAEAALHDAQVHLTDMRANSAAFSEQTDSYSDYGCYSGRFFPHGAASLAARMPHYRIALLGKIADTQAAAVQRYRITAVGFGARESTRVMLQVIYTGSGDGTLRKLSWREIIN
ncbi:MAG: PilX N-terminal domain-containing pilus assembly protein [Herbaspirillum sp.]